MPRPIPHFGWPTVSFEINRESPQARGIQAWWPPLGSRGQRVLRGFARKINGAFPGGGNDPTWTSDAVHGSVLTYDGGSDYIPMGTGRLDMSGAITIAFWNYVAAADVQQSSAFGGFGTDSNFDRCQAHAPWIDNSLYWDYGDIFGNGRISAAYAVYLDKWTHVALVSEGIGGAFKAIYLDGLLAASAGNSDGPSGPVVFDMGRAVLFATEYHIASMGDFRVYNRRLVGTEVWRLYAPETRWDLYETPMVPRARSPVVAAFLAERGVYRGAWRGIYRGM